MKLPSNYPFAMRLLLFGVTLFGFSGILLAETRAPRATVATTSLAVLPTSFEYSPSGGKGQVSVKATSETVYAITGVPDWISGFPASGSGVQIFTFTVSANAETASRTASFTIGSISVTVTQEGATNILNTIEAQIVSIEETQSSCGSNAIETIVTLSLTNTGQLPVYQHRVTLEDLPLEDGSIRLITADGANCVDGGLIGARQTFNFGGGLAPGQTQNVQLKFQNQGKIRIQKPCVCAIPIIDPVTGKITFKLVPCPCKF